MHEKPKNWTGRIDGNKEEHLRWHQVMQLEIIPKTQAVILGFACDEGVRRNKGRIGAKGGPNALRVACSNFPVHEKLNIADCGDVICEGQNLEKAQEELAERVAEIQNKNLKSIVFGGGHEVLFGHYSGIRKAYPTQKIGIINFDAHFDNRDVVAEIGPTSGTGFSQIYTTEKKATLLSVGIQKNSNTRALFEKAQENDHGYILSEDFDSENSERIDIQISEFLTKIDFLYVSVCMDVFAAAYAPGVSATAYNGLIPDRFFMKVFKKIISSEKLVAFDIAEVNPDLDIDSRTAKLGAALIFEVINSKK